ncbi:MAG: TraB/GumN family protein, partial [Pontixanthobacter sp.]
MPQSNGLAKRLAKAFLPMVALTALLPGACKDSSGDQILTENGPAPALWQITNGAGEIEGWLFGTIHSLPDGVIWRTPKLQQAIGQSELLVVEISGLADEDAVSQVFGELARSTGLPPLLERVEPQYRSGLEKLMAQGHYRSGDFTATESWAAALTLAQITATGESENGIDRAIIADFAGKPVLELEGARAQLGIFDTLPEADQRDLLEAVVEEFVSESSAKSDELAAVWLRGDMKRLSEENSQGMLADPELKAALLTGRNEAWARSLAQMMPAQGKMMIAVGAAHMAGDGGLPAILGRSGYT